MTQTRTISIFLLATALLSGCLGKKKAAAPAADNSAAPDKLLYQRASDDIKRGRYTQGRLSLQTLINSYPDSEYLAKAKLGIADSYFKEGGSSGLKESILEYKDFITFFPFLDEAPYAQLQVGLAHYNQMEKPDRDRAEAVEAEAELQTFLEKYPSSPLAPQAEQRLRETQEVLAEGNFRVARFYYLRGAYRASGARLLELTTRYPLYSQADQANWMLGQIYEKGEQNQIAARYYSRIVKDYPLSPLVGDAKEKLTKFAVPVPAPDPAAVARMKKDVADSHRPGMLAKSVGMLSTRPDVTAAAHAGAPNLTPSGESGDETLSVGGATQTNVGAGSSPGNSATVETVTPGSSAPAASSTDTSAPASSDTTDSSSSGSATDADAAQPASTSSSTQPANTGKESTSKKKKGLHKLNPF